MNFNKQKYLYSSIAKATDPFFGQKIENKPDFTILSIFLQFHQKCKKITKVAPTIPENDHCMF